MKKFTMLLVMLIFVQLAISATITLNVTVFKDKSGGALLSGIPVTVSCSAAGYTTNTISTNASGLASFTDIIKPTTGSYTYTIAITGVTGYTNYSTTKSISSTATSPQASSAIFLSNYNLNFTVNDGINPIPGATVTISGTAHDVSTGTYTFVKSYTTSATSYTVSAPGFADSTATATIVYSASNQNFNIPAIVMKPAYNINFNVTDNASNPISGASIVLTGYGSTTLSTAATGLITFPKKKNGNYSYIITKTGYVDAVGQLIVNGSDYNFAQPIQMATGANFTFTVKRGKTNLSNDSITINGITKITNSSGVVTFGLPLGANNFTNQKYAYINKIGTINVDGVNLTTDTITLRPTPIYSVLINTRDANNSIISGATVVFNNKVYTTNASGNVLITPVSPIDNPNVTKQYYYIKITKTGYGDYVDSVNCGLAGAGGGTNNYLPSTTNRFTINSNYFYLSYPRIDVNYSAGQLGANSFATLILWNSKGVAVDHSDDIFYQGGGSIIGDVPGTTTGVTPDTYSYFMVYLDNGVNGYGPARGKVTVGPHTNAKISVVFDAGYLMVINVLDNQGNPVQGAQVFAADTTVTSDANGAANFSTRYNGIYPYNVVLKDGNGIVIGRAKGSVTIAGTANTTELAVIQTVYNVTFKVDDNFGNPYAGATVTVDNASVTTDATGNAIIPCMNGTANYTVMPATNDYLTATGNLTVNNAATTTTIYLSKTASMSFTVTDANTNPIQGAYITVGNQTMVSDVNGMVSFTKTLKSGYTQYNCLISAEGYADSTFVEYLNTDMTLTIALKNAYDVVLTVNNPMNIPMENVTLMVGNSTVLTNPLGQYTFRKLINGNYNYVASMLNFADAFGTITVNGAGVNQTITLGTGYNVTFTVINGSTGTKGLSNDMITINGESKMTDANGMVTFGVLPNTSLSFTHSRAGFVDVPVTISNINANTSYTIYCTPVYSVQFSVLDLNSYNPVQGASIAFNGTTLLTDMNGNATFTGIAPSATDYSYTVTGPTTYNVVTGAVTLASTSTDANLATNNVVAVSAMLTSPSIYVALTSSGGFMPYYSDATISIDGVNYAYDTGFGGNTINCSLGTHQWIITPADITMAIVKGTVVVSDFTPVYLPINMVAGRKIDLYTIDASSNALQGTQVTFDGETKTTDVTGEASYTRKPAGAYTYTASLAGYITQSNVALTVANVDVVQTITMLKVPVKVTFTVTENGTPLANTTVTIGTTIITTDATGKAVFTETIGSYNYSVTKTSYNTVTGSVNVVDVDQNISIALVRTPYKVNFVVSELGVPLANAAITIGTTTLNTDASGKASFTETFGTYNYSISKTAYTTVTGSLTVATSDVNQTVYLVKTTYSATFTVTSNGFPVASALLTINGNTTNTSATGVATITGLLPATYPYTLTAAGLNNVSGSITISTANVNQSITMIQSVYSVTFNVTVAGVAVPGATILFDGASMSTNSQGLVVFANKLPGNYVYTVTGVGLNDYNGSVALGFANAGVNVAMTVTTYSVNFTVTDRNGVLANATITFNGTTATSDAQGKATFANVLPGTYTYSISKAGYTVGSGSITITTQNVNQPVNLISTGVSSIDIVKAKPYPNPTSGVIYISTKSIAAGTNIAVTNVLGQTVRMFKVANGGDELSINIGDLKQGIYYIIMNNASEKYTWRIVKQ